MKNGKRKQLLALLLVLVMCFSLLPVSAFAEDGVDGEPVSEEQEEYIPETEPEEDPAPHEHSYVPTVTEPSCEAGGYTTWTCSCGDSYVTDETGALGHTAESVEAVAPTRTEAGHEAGTVCAACGKVLEGCEVIEALPEETAAALAEEITPQADSGKIPIDEAHFPDEYFREWIRGQIAEGGSHLTDEMIRKTTVIKIISSSIESLEGIRFFTNLQTLDCSGCTALSELDLSGCTSLTALDCSACTNLEELDFSGCSALTTLNCSRCAALVYLSCSGCSALTTLNCSGCKYLCILYLDGCAALTTLDCSGCDVYLYGLDLTGCVALTTLNCSGCAELEELDCSGCAALTTLDCSGCTVLYDLDLADCAALTTLNCSGSGLDSLCISEHASLTTVDCSDCRYLTDLNLSGCEALTTVDCSGCSYAYMRWMYFTGCTALTTLDCSGCAALPGLALYGCAALTTLDCSGCAALTGLDLYGFAALTTLDCSGCTGLNKLYCDDSDLTELDLDGCTGLKELYCNANRLTELDLSGCAALEVLLCASNRLTELDLSGCAALRNLACSGNPLAELDLRGFPDLIAVYCESCALTELHADGLEYLALLFCYDNRLTGLDLSGCKGLQWLDCSYNELTVLDLNACADMRQLNCLGNPLTALDLSGSEDLTACIAGGVTDSGLDLRGNTWLLFGEYSDEEPYLVVDESVARAVMVPAAFPPGQLALNFTYRLMGVGDSMPLLSVPSDDPAALFPVELDARWADRICWEVAGEDGIVPEDPAELAISITPDGSAVTASHPGTAYVVVKIPGWDVSACCRIDVTEAAGTVREVRLAGNKAAVELYKEDYTHVTVIPVLEQNDVHMAAVDINPLNAVPQADADVTIESAVFVEDGSPKSAGIKEAFKLRVADDRTLEIVPIESAVQNPASVRGSYTAEIAVTIRGNTFTTEPLTLTVKKSLPKITAKVGKLNSFLIGSTQAVSFSGEPAESVGISEQLPEWLDFNATTRSFVYAGEPEAARSAKLNLKVKPVGWRVELNVPVTVSAAKSAPKLKVTPASLSLYPGVGDWVSAALTVTPGTFNEPLLLPVEVVSVTEKGKDATSAIDVYSHSSGLTVYEGSAAPKDGKAHTYKVTLAMMRKNAAGQYEPTSAKTTITVKLLSAKTNITMSAKAAGVIDTAVYQSAARVTVTIKGLSYYSPYEGDFTVWREKKGQERKDVTDYFTIERIEQEGATSVFLFYANDPNALESGFTYTAELKGSPGGKEMTCSVKLPVKFSDPAKVRPGVTLNAKGAIDVIRPDSSVTVTPMVKNCPSYLPVYDMSRQDLVFWKQNGKAFDRITDEDDNPFFVRVEDGAFVLTLKPGADIDLSQDKFKVSLDAEVRDNNDQVIAHLESPQISVSMKMGTAKVAQSTKAVTLLNDDRFDRGVITLTPEVGLSDINWGKTLDHFASPKDKNGRETFELVPLGGSSFVIAYRSRPLNPDDPGSPVEPRLPEASFKGGTVKIPVFFTGNTTGKPNATVSVSVKLA